MNPEYDPDFGDVQPDHSDIYVVVVTPKSNLERNIPIGWSLLMFLPQMETETQSSELVSDILSCFLVEGDHFYARPYKEEDFKNYKSMPVISYDPEKMYSGGGDYEIEDLFFWLRPPSNFMH